jgi:hypothetical protein
MIKAILRGNWRVGLIGLIAMASSSIGVAQVSPVDPNKAIDGDLSASTKAAPAATTPAANPATVAQTQTPAASAPPAVTASQAAVDPAQAVVDGTTYKQDDLIGAAEGLFGKGAQGLASMIQDLLKKQGEPNAYIVGREGGGAVGLGIRYGSGTLHHKVEGKKTVYWTGPSVGVDLGANAADTFVLVYNLYNTEDLYQLYGAAEGQAYVVGGFNVSYLRRGDVVLIPVRMGAGLRLGISAGYMKFAKKQRWLPF